MSSQGPYRRSPSRSRWITLASVAACLIIGVATILATWDWNRGSQVEELPGERAPSPDLAQGIPMDSARSPHESSPSATGDGSPGDDAAGPSDLPVEETVALPALAESDAFVAQRAAAVSDEIPRSWSNTPGLVKRFVAATQAVALGEDPVRHLRFMRPVGRFEAALSKQGELVIGDAVHTRYRPIVRVIASIDPRMAAQTITLFAPLLDEAYQALGNPKGVFEPVLLDAIETLLQTPIVDAPSTLRSESVMYQFDDENLENLDPTQKILLRLAPSDQRMVHAKLRALRQALLRFGSSGTLNRGAPPQ